MSTEKTYPQRNFSLGENITKRAADKLMRNNLQNVYTLKNRLKVLSSQADYNKFRSKYQTQKIEKHNTIHEIAVSEKKQILERLKTRVDVQQKKVKAQKIKSQIKDKLNDVFEKLMQEKVEKRNEIKVRSQKNRQILNIRKARDFQKRKELKEEVSLMQNGLKETLQKYVKQKKQQVKAVEELQKQNLINYSLQMARQLEILSQKEKELIELNSQSMQNSRFLDLQFKKLYQSKSKDSSLHLPLIKHKSPANSKSTQIE